MIIKGVKSKKISNNFRISIAQYRKDTAFIYVYSYKDNRKYKIGEFKQTSKNQEGLSIYNGHKTVKQIKKLIQNKEYIKF
jgi:hypothetical protein